MPLPRSILRLTAASLALLPPLLPLGAARAQLGPVPSITTAIIGKPNGVAPLDAQGSAGGLVVLGQTLAGRASTVIDVRDYGARCDGTGDDSAAFNAAINAARSRIAGGAPLNAKLTWAGCVAVIRSTLNFTGLKTNNLTIDGGGGLLLGYTNGKPVIDALHTETLRFRDVSIYGVGGAGNLPNIGMQIGRTGTNDPADGMSLQDVSINGYYSFAALYNLGSEVSQFGHLYLNNATIPGAGGPTSCYALVQDGINHWNAHSDFVTETIAPDTFLSFDDDLFTNPQITASGGCTPLFLASTSGHKFVGGYVSNFNGLTAATGSGYEAVLWNAAGIGQENKMLDFDNFHMETYPTDIFYVTGPNHTPVLRDFRFHETYEQATNSIFKLDPAITGATLNGLDLKVSDYIPAPPYSGVFDAPAKWAVTGSVRLGQYGHWTQPAAFKGLLDQAGALAMVTDSLTTGPLSAGGTVAAGAQLSAPGFSTGSDPSNGNLGLGTTGGTPYFDFYGAANMRLIGDGAHQLSVQDHALGSPIASFHGSAAGNAVVIHGSFGNDGAAGFNGAAPVGRADITGSCGGSTACQKIGALLISAGLASGTVSP